MLAALVKKIIGSQNDRYLKRINKLVKIINSFEADIEKLDDAQLKEKTQEFRHRLSQGATPDKLLPEAFAVCREAGKRTLGMRHFDVQMIGGIALHEGQIAEMRTGEGKTLAATLAAYLNALPGKGVHIVTVNNYLAARDANWMRPLYEFLGLTVGIVVSQQDSAEKRQAYQADITYGTNNEFGFDYLRDNMAFEIADKLQRGREYAIVDEVDSILIDEARTPLIISGPADDSSDLYLKINEFIPGFRKQIGEGEKIEKEGHYIIDEKQRQVELTELGHEYVEQLLYEAGLLEKDDSLYSANNLTIVHHVLAALRAHLLFHKNVEYIVSSKEIVLIDEHTGRTMPGRRLSEGLHQAIEAKEHVPIQAETQTLASTTFQNYFRLYNKLSGMTGTADTEAYEMHEIYGLDVIIIPTNQPVNRQDLNDLVFLTLQEKYTAIIEDIQSTVQAQRPTLVGTASIESSELLSSALDKAGIKHEVLNAKFHEREAEIIAQAGSPGAITIATNMAGRGTDIILGGNWESEVAALDNPSDDEIRKIKEDWKKRHQQVVDAGGLHIIGTERHESRRIDNQLRGRSGRQGDPGSSRFYLSLDDSLMRIFVSERIKGFMQSMDSEGGVIESRMVSNAIEKAQRKVEGRNFDIRKQLLEYDDVANAQRLIVYQQRDEILNTTDVQQNINSMREDMVRDIVTEYIPPDSMEEQWDIAALEKRVQTDVGLNLPVQQWLDEDDTIAEKEVSQRILSALFKEYEEKEMAVGEEAIRSFEKHILLRVLDEKWKEHLNTMDHLRQGIHLRGYASRNPKDEYKREAYNLFENLLHSIRQDVISTLSHVKTQMSDDARELERQRYEQMMQNMQYQHEGFNPADMNMPGKLPESASGSEQTSLPSAPFVREERKVGRNEPCPCGSGKKYKQCHGKI